MAYDPELADRLRAVLPEATEKRMFGGLAFLVDGHMILAAGSNGELLLRADPQRVDELLTDPRVAPFEMRGKPMRGWLGVTVDADVDAAELQAWVDQAVAYAATLD